MKSAGKVALALTAALLLPLLVTGELSAPAEAARPSQKQALAACRAKYGKDITSAVVQKNGQIVCQEGPGGQATREQVFEWCKKKFSATTVTVQKRGKRWHCRYYGRY